MTSRRAKSNLRDAGSKSAFGLRLLDLLTLLKSIAKVYRVRVLTGKTRSCGLEDPVIYWCQVIDQGSVRGRLTRTELRICLLAENAVRVVASFLIRIIEANV